MTARRRLTTCVALMTFAASALAQQKPAKTELQQLNPLADIKAVDLKSFSDRPLFSPSRRPPEVVEATTAIGPQETDTADSELTLLGVTSGPDGSQARIKSESETTSHSLRQGESIAGWTIQMIDASSVTMKKGGETRLLTIFGNRLSDFQSQDDGEPEEPGPGIVFGDETDPVPKVRVIDPN